MADNSHKSGKVFRNAAFDWASGAVYRAWRRGAPGFATDVEIARTIAD
jgi:hypothetical protein